MHTTWISKVCTNFCKYRVETHDIYCLSDKPPPVASAWLSFCKEVFSVLPHSLNPRNPGDLLSCLPEDIAGLTEVHHHLFFLICSV